MKKIKISFSKEVAETLGLESAVILELFNQNLLDNSSYDDLVLSINKNANYLDNGKIESSSCRRRHVGGVARDKRDDRAEGRVAARGHRVASAAARDVRGRREHVRLLLCHSVRDDPVVAVRPHERRDVSKRRLIVDQPEQAEMRGR